jgi:uncharacterized LabA/DUF88 family protein
MFISSGGYRGPREVSYLFIDGGYFRKTVEGVVERYCNSERFSLDYSKLGSGFTKSFYYDGPIPRRRGEPLESYSVRLQEQVDLHNSIRNISGFHVFVGALVGNGGRARQKQIDVKISVDMLMHTIRRNMHQATLIAGDQDFKPLLDALVQEGMYVTLWCESGHTSSELAFAADARRPLNVSSIYQLFPDEIRRKYPLPAGVCSEKRTEGFDLLSTGSDEKGDPIELYQSDCEFMILTSNPNPGYWSHYRHSRLEILEMFLREVHAKIFKW